MKKLFVFLLSIILVMSSVCAYGALPPQLTGIPMNYSSDMTFSASLENADELIDFVLSFEDDIAAEYGVVDLKTLLRSLFDISGNATLKGDISEDYKKIQLFMSGDVKCNVNLNQNLDMTVTPKFGMWMDMDLTNSENPVMNIILHTPASSKYYVVNVFELMQDEDKKKVSDVLGMIFNSQIMEGIAESSVSTLEKYADIKTKGSKCTVTLDNDSVMAMYSELFENYAGVFGALAPSLGQLDEYVYVSEELPDMSGLEIFGKDGIVIEYILGRNGVEQEICSVDTDINVPAVYTLVTGDEWKYEEDLTIDFNITVGAKYYDYGRTTVEFPLLTEENSINISDMMLPDGEYEYSESYPNEWFYFNPSGIPVVDSVMYVPFREVMHEVYGDTAVITESNGTLTAVCDSPDGKMTVSLAEGSNTAYLDGNAHNIAGVMNIDGVKYVDSGLFTEAMGWEFEYASYNVVNGEYTLAGSTYRDSQDETAPYPDYIAYAQSRYLPIREGQVYLPLRALLESAYGDSLNIDYTNGRITATSRYFPGFATLVLNVGDGRVYADSHVFETTPCFTENSTTYVHPEIFTDLFGWELEYIENDILTGTYSVSYTTWKYVEITADEQ